MKQSSPLRYIALLFLMFGLTACLDVTEEYHFNKDGSGSARFTVDISKMMAMLESFGGAMDSLGGEDGSNSIKEMFSDRSQVDILKSIPGIKNVKSLSSEEAKIIGYSFDFDDLEALNNAVAVNSSDMGLTAMLGAGDSGEEEEAGTNSFMRKGKKFTRTLQFPMPEEDDEEAEHYKSMAAMLFADHFYSQKYTFEGGVKKVKKNDNASVQSDRKTVLIKTPLTDLLEGAGDMGAMIKLR